MRSAGGCRAAIEIHPEIEEVADSLRRLVGQDADQRGIDESLSRPHGVLEVDIAAVAPVAVARGAHAHDFAGAVDSAAALFERGLGHEPYLGATSRRRKRRPRCRAAAADDHDIGFDVNKVDRDLSHLSLLLDLSRPGAQTRISRATMLR